ncbi:unnamed protein product [Rhodiola kirilowii]
MDRFIFPQGGGAASSLMGAAQHPLTTSASATRFMSKPKAEKKSHSEAESRRRKRINDHLVTLRSILPSKVKTDKATLLLETVQHVKELQQKFAEVGLPSESDTVSVSRCENADDDDEKKNDLVVKATVCCEDRAELNRDLVRVIRSVRGNMTRTEMATVGGRTKVVMDLKLGVESSGGDQEEIGRLKRGLRAVVENRVSGHSFGVGGRLTVSNKRGRFVMSDNGGMSN